MTTLPDINLLTGRQIEEILKTCDSYLGKKLGLEGAVENTKLPVVVSSLNITWNSIENFEKDVNLLAKENNIRSAYSTLYTKWEQKLAQEKSEKVEKTTLTPEEAEKLEEEAQKRKTEAKESTEAAQKKQEQWLKLQKEKLPEPVSKEEQEKTLEELKGKVVYATPQKPEPEINLTEKEESFANLAKQNPRVFEQKLAADIIKKNPEIFKSEELKPLADVIATDTTKIFIDPSQKPIPAGVFAALTKYKESPEIQKTGSLFTLFSEERQNLYREILNRTVGTNLANRALGFPETVYEFSQTPPERPEGSFSIKLDDLQRNSFTFQESPLFQTFDNPLLGEAKTAVSGQLKDFALSKISSLPKEGFFSGISRFATSGSFDSIAPFLGLPTQMTYTGTSFFGKMITTFLPEYAPIITNFAAKLGIDIGIKALAPVVAETAGGTAIAPVVGAVAKTGLGGAISGWLTSVGITASIPVVNAIVFIGGLLVTLLARPVLEWIKKHQEDLKILGLVMLGGGAVLRSIPMFVFGGLIFIPTALRTGFSMAGIAARTAFFFGRIGTSMAITIGTPIIVAIIVFPILVAIILFIINSGAYIVPPSSGGGNVINPYIKVEKIIQESNTNLIKFKNSDLPQTVHYTVKILALKGILQKVKITYKCSVSKKGSPVNCPDPDPDIPTDEIAEISPSTPHTFSYSHKFTSPDFVDSLIVDTITAEAFVPGDSVNAQTAGSASVVIGTPPSECPSIWPVSSSGWVSQGSFAPGCTHRSMEALDIAGAGMTVVAANSGIVKQAGYDDCYGRFVDIESACNSTPFTSRYAHLEALSISSGQPVTLGTIIGISGNTGSCSYGAHLHYDFRGKSYPNNPPYMMKPYLPVDIIRGCCSDNGNPCNQSVP